MMKKKCIIKHKIFLQTNARSLCINKPFGTVIVETHTIIQRHNDFNDDDDDVDGDG